MDTITKAVERPAGHPCCCDCVDGLLTAPLPAGVLHVWCCPSCLCFDVQAKQWIGINDGKQQGECDDDDYWCPGCEDTQRRLLHLRADAPGIWKGGGCKTVDAQEAKAKEMLASEHDRDAGTWAPWIEFGRTTSKGR